MSYTDVLNVIVLLWQCYHCLVSHVKGHQDNPIFNNYVYALLGQSLFQEQSQSILKGLTNRWSGATWKAQDTYSGEELCEGLAGSVGGLGQAKGPRKEVKLWSRDERHMSMFSSHLNLSLNLWPGHFDVVGATMS